jgi:glutaredoxin
MPSYEMDLQKFEGYNTQVLGISVDHIPCLKAWAESLGGISYPLLSDFWPHGWVALKYGVLRPDGKSERALFIVDKAGIVRYADVHDIDKQPDNEELFRVLRALETQAPAGAGIGPAAAVRDAAPAPVVASAPVQQSVPVAVGSAAQPPPAAKPSRVIMYCRPGCIDCRLARRFLEQNGVQFTEVNVLASPGAEARVRAWTGGPLISPVFDLDGTIIVDFQRAELIKRLGL